MITAVATMNLLNSVLIFYASFRLVYLITEYLFVLLHNYFIQYKGYRYLVKYNEGQVLTCLFYAAQLNQYLIHSTNSRIPFKKQVIVFIAFSR